MVVRKRQVGGKQRPKPNNTAKKITDSNEIEKSDTLATVADEIPTMVFNAMAFKGYSGFLSSNEDEKQEQPSNCKIRNLEYYHRFSLKIIIALTFLTRFYKINDPASVCWDEAHFGKFANFYLNGTLFFDVHPPLGKMLLALAGHMTYYDGRFPFGKPMDAFDNDTNFVGMRMFSATLGGSCVILVYLTVWKLTRSLPAALLSASFVLFDTGCITISQYILLDPILLFFIMTSIYSIVNFRQLKEQTFTNKWWAWLLGTGFFLGCAISVKWVGLFIVLFVGVSTVHDLWNMLGDIAISLKDFGKQLMARVLGLIAVPIFAYLFFFAIHFSQLRNSGGSDGFFSTAMQSTLNGNSLHNIQVSSDLAYGSVLRLRCHRVSGGLLHSHLDTYPKEFPPELQSVTGYSFIDPNNQWRIHKAKTISIEFDPLELVRDGDVIRLMHVNTRRNLHSHRHAAPLSTGYWQVAAYGENGLGDEGDLWRIEIVKYPSKHEGIKTLRTLFRLIHAETGCALSETGLQLPDWGNKQLEIACVPSTHIQDSRSTLWSIYANEHKQVPQVNTKTLAPSFFERLVESHIIMATTNNEFKAKDNEDPSQPWQWPINYRGQIFANPDPRIYLLGNPILWWGILVILFLFFGYFIFFEIRFHRGLEVEPKKREKSRLVIGTCTWLMIGWALHYLPFYLMNRVLYFHHYFPSYLISAMLAGILLEHVIALLTSFHSSASTQRKMYFYSIGSVIAISFLSFYWFRDVTYGMYGPTSIQQNTSYAAYKWLDSWEI